MTRTLGMLFFVLGGVVLLLGVLNLTAQWSDAGYITDNPRQFKIDLSSTDLRLAMGLQLIGEILVVGGLVAVGWFLYASELEQTTYLIASGVVLVGMIAVRVTPVLPLSVARYSINAALFGTRVRLELQQPEADQTSQWLTMPLNDFQRVVVWDPHRPAGRNLAILDFQGDAALRDAYLGSQPPVVVIGSAQGTRTIAQKSTSHMVPRIKVIRLEHPTTGGT
jgi:hypothetical protein